MTLAVIIGLFGYTIGVKIYAALKAFGIKVEDLSKEEFEELLKDKRFQKYMR